MSKNDYESGPIAKIDIPSSAYASLDRKVHRQRNMYGSGVGWMMKCRGESGSWRGERREGEREGKERREEKDKT